MNSDYQDTSSALLNATARIVAAYVTAHKTPLDDVQSVISSVYSSLEYAHDKAGFSAEGRVNDIDIEASVTPEYLVCLEDGKKLKMLKRYLKTNFDMTPEEYRKRWNLPPDYPMVAPNYAKRRSQLAKDIGLGKQSLKQKKQAAFAKLKGGLPMGKGRLRIVKSTDIMTARHHLS
jgi:predicted transcriptional regulator